MMPDKAAAMAEYEVAIKAKAAAYAVLNEAYAQEKATLDAVATAEAASAKARERVEQARETIEGIIAMGAADA
ncbi:MAG: hypothetical protein Q7S17_07665 [Xanthobacteraceae bacterium]|nr:hypothetical protein [Xanthobacteraceae bacterium]